MMASSVDHKSADPPGRGPAYKARTGTRAKPRLEELETRCLLSGLRPAMDPYHKTAHSFRATSPLRERLTSHSSPSSATIQHAPPAASASEPSSLSDDDDSTYGMTGSTQFSPSSVGLGGPAGGSYTVVFETKAPHHTKATAQVLPDLPFFGVVGTISTSDAVDFYRLTLNENVEELNFGLAFQRNGQVAAFEFQIFDGAGQLLGEWSSGEQGASIVLAQLGLQAAGSTLYLGISAGNQSGTAALSAGVGYQLWVSRESAPDQSTESPQGSSSVPIATLSSQSAGALTPLAAVGTAPGRGTPDVGAAGTSISPGGLPIGLAVGPPAIRAGRPSVEALSSGEFDRLTDRDFDAVLPQDAGEQNPGISSVEERHAGDPGSKSEAEPDAGALVAMNGPGGFALLGAVAMGHRRTIPTATLAGAGVAATLPAQVPAPGVADLGIAPSAAIVVAQEQGLIDYRSIRARLRDGLPSSLFSGFGLAVAFTLNAAFSQPFAEFDYFARRYDSDRRKLLPRRRKAAR